MAKPRKLTKVAPKKRQSRGLKRLLLASVGIPAMAASLSSAKGYQPFPQPDPCLLITP